MEEYFAQVSEIVSPVYMVGGSVRDMVLGASPKDYDFATPLLPDEIEQRIRDAGRRAYVTGKRFGTVGFTINRMLMEITTFRSETYGKTRKPTVSFVESLEQDLSRRDFTINALAWDGKDVIDPFDGQSDLSRKIIRCVGKPGDRFREDPLRMLRAARFASQLGFDVEVSTQRAMTKYAHTILSVSKERWMQELDKMLTGPYPEKGLRLLAETDLLKFILPELRLQVGYDQNSDWHALTLWDHTISTVTLAPNTLDARWAALLHDVGKPFVRAEKADGKSRYTFHDIVGSEMITGIAKRMKWSRERTDAVSELVRTHMQDDSPIREADNASKTEEAKRRLKNM